MSFSKTVRFELQSPAHWSKVMQQLCHVPEHMLVEQPRLGKMQTSTRCMEVQEIQECALALPGAVLILTQHIQLVLAGTSSHADRAKLTISSYYAFWQVAFVVCIKLYQNLWSFQAQSKVQLQPCNPEAIRAAMSPSKKLAVEPS